MINQLVTIAFRQDDQEARTDWYHVPRKGEFVTIGKNKDGDPLVQGIVHQVFWHEDYVEVLVR